MLILDLTHFWEYYLPASALNDCTVLEGACELPGKDPGIARSTRSNIAFIRLWLSRFRWPVGVSKERMYSKRFPKADFEA